MLALIRAPEIRCISPIISPCFTVLRSTSAQRTRPTDRPRSGSRRSRTVTTLHLAALHFQYGRYLLLSCSRPGGQPATLQGLWNDSLSPPWGASYTVNINTEMNYWPAAPANLLECYAPLFAMLAELSEAGQNTAKVQYGAGGWVCHHNTDGWRGTAPVDCARSGACGRPAARGFASRSGTITSSRATGRRCASHYPVMKGAAQFFLDTLVEEPTHQWLVTNPSISPENAHHPDASVCAGPTMDSQILRDLFDACAQASDDLSDGRRLPGAGQGRPRPARPHADRAGGQVQEWLEDWDADAPEQHHRHVSHPLRPVPQQSDHPARDTRPVRCRP